MTVMSPSPPHFYSILVVFLLCRVGIGLKDTMNKPVNETLQNISIVGTLSPSLQLKAEDGSPVDTVKEVAIATGTKEPLGGMSAQLERNVTTPRTLNKTHDIPPQGADGTELDQHSTTISPSISTGTVRKGTTISSVNNVSSARITSSPLISESHNSSISPTVAVHRKSKPEETHVDDIVRDSGPTTDYVVPLVVAMLAVPLVGVMCALLYMKGRDFWERRHYGRIDFLWDNRNDSRMDFLIDGMYNN